MQCDFVVSQYAPHPKKTTPVLTLRDQASMNWFIHHQHYDCSLFVWISQAWLKQPQKFSLPRYQVFVEFRDSNRCCRYHEFTFSKLEEALQFIHGPLAHRRLINISPHMTRLYPVKKDN
ncbi:hypothetical protein [Zooshikella harenae]|uniref:Uncharacterized protein n=1 Tax=Zooshikella harenae TaxID=2827238 RepID=A0ABS5ZFA7_9GAMM|nr:hypothetical protein [Zooshikella harenae]MBU2712443.1 hypothetical protein [Zooshikella harenae]